ncbi:MAG: FIST N-terminal domain-containing protein [Sulfurimonas sp.]
MKLRYYTYKGSWNEPLDKSLDSKQTLIFAFGLSNKEAVTAPLREVKDTFGHSIIIGASTAGEILMDELHDDSLVIAVLQFKTTKIKLITKKIQNTQDSFFIGESIAHDLDMPHLKSIFILSDGLQINGSQLSNGFNSIIKSDVVISGGLAGDGGAFVSTWVIVDGEAKSGYVSAIGLYGDAIHVGYGSKGGWDIFGIKREVTKAVNNTVYELNKEPILDIYKRYLEDKAKDLPASGLLFPLGIYHDNTNENITARTILAINEEEKSITFAGDIPKGSQVCLMKSNNDRLIDAASTASKEINLQNYTNEPLLSLAISCIGRKLVLKQRTEDELEATLQNLPKDTIQIGFYSYGEISPHGLLGSSLHNQTMTLTTLWESDA